MKLIIQCFLFVAISVTSTYGQNYSLHFDGNDDYALLPKSEALVFPSFTIEGWFKCQPFSDPQTVLMSFLDIPDRNANVTVEVRENGLLRFNYRSVAEVLGGDDLFSTTVVNDNVWHHFAVVKEGNERIWLYIDGFPEAVSCGFYPTINLVPITELGRNRYDLSVNYRAFKGNIDDLKIWNRAKNCREIFNDYKSESAGVELGLFSNYKFDINQDTIYDCSINKKHGTRKGVLGANNLPQYSTDIPTLMDKMCEIQFVNVDDELQNPGSDALALITPNPASEILKVTLIENQKILGQIYTADGKLIRTFSFTDKLNDVDVSTLPSGAYFLKLNNDKTSQMHPFIKI
jgi:hypothetical protein